MRETIAFIVFAFTFPVPTQVLIIAGLVVAVVIFFGAILLFRNPGKKKGANVDAPGWQPQGQQQGMQGGWNQQGMGGPTDNAWGQQQQPAGWGAPNSAQQPQQPAGWGAQQQQPAGWGAPNSAQQPQQPGGWGSPAPAQQQQPAGWGAPNSAQQPQQPGGWGSPAPAQQQSASSWGNPGSPQQQSTPWSNASPNTPSAGAAAGGNQPAWDATFMPQQPAGQDSWGQPAPMQQGAPVWGTVPGGQAAAQNSAPAQQQQAQTAYGGSGSGQSWGQPNQSPQPADPWNMASAQPQSASPQSAWGQPLQSQPSTGGNQGMPAWQQGSQGMGGAAVPGSPGMRPDAAALFGGSDNDKTMLRPGGSQGTMGIVRVEEGKEPGRVYEVRKEELSIGRSRESDIFLEDLAVSRLHAKIVSMGNGNYALKDEGSANGTKVNGQLVNKYQTYPLQEGDKIQLGQTVLVFARR